MVRAYIRARVAKTVSRQQITKAVIEVWCSSQVKVGANGSENSFKALWISARLLPRYAAQFRELAVGQELTQGGVVMDPCPPPWGACRA